MLFYIFLVAIVNTGVGFALAVYLARRYRIALAERGLVDHDVLTADVAAVLADMESHDGGAEISGEASPDEPAEKPTDEAGCDEQESIDGEDDLPNDLTPVSGI